MPVNRMSLEGELPFGGNWLGSNQENLVLTPSIAGPFLCRALRVAGGN
jgi:hypothetical protein